MSRNIVVIAHNIRSTHNVGSILRTCEGLGITKLYLSGYTPYPKTAVDDRLPHIAEKLHKQINKTALGAEDAVAWEHHTDVKTLIHQLAKTGYAVTALEQSDTSISLPSFKTPQKIALLLGEEVEGVSAELLAQCAATLEIPMFGKKESFNVSVAAAMALYHFRFC